VNASAGGTPVIVALPLWPSAVAAIVAVPGPTPLISAVVESVPVCVPTTVATAVLLVVHVTACPGSVFPPASLTVARREKDTPTSLRAVAGLMLTAKRVGSMGWSPPQAASTRMPNQSAPADIRFICDLLWPTPWHRLTASAPERSTRV